jgi:hypothetical protein
MLGLGPSIHGFFRHGMEKGVDDRHKAGHDDLGCCESEKP